MSRVGIGGGLSFALLLALGAAGEGTDRSAVTLESLADGVWRAHAPNAAPGGLNALVVERNDGVLVVDTLGSPALAAALLDRLRARGMAPVRYLVFTHAHADATGGAAAFGESVLVAAARGAHDSLADKTSDVGAEARARSAEPGTWVEPPRRVPVLTLDAPARLEDGRNPVELLPVHGAHTPGDLVVHVEGTGVYAVGDLVAGDRNPWAEEANLARWIASLNSLAKLRPETIFPLRGEPTDPRGLRIQRESFTWAVGQVEQGYVDLVPSDRIPERVLAAESLGNYFDMKAEPSFAASVVDAALRRVREDRRKRGMPE